MEHNKKLLEQIKLINEILVYKNNTEIEISRLERLKIKLISVLDDRNIF